MAGIAPQRKIPAFAPQTFKGWFRQREPRNVGKLVVMLWPDTFNDHFHPETAIAAVEVLEKETLIIAGGFSCREQIAQTTDRRALHLAQVIQMAIHKESEGRKGSDGATQLQVYPEERYTVSNRERSKSSQTKILPAVVGVGIAVLGGILAWILRKKQ